MPGSARSLSGGKPVSFENSLPVSGAPILIKYREMPLASSCGIACVVREAARSWQKGQPKERATTSRVLLPSPSPPVAAPPSTAFPGTRKEETGTAPASGSLTRVTRAFFRASNWRVEGTSSAQASPGRVAEGAGARRAGKGEGEEVEAEVDGADAAAAGLLWLP